jgi:hypothetical protein
MIDQLLAKMTPQQLKMLPPSVQALLKKYGSWSKVPKAERDKVGVDMAGMLTQLTIGSMDDINAALAGTGDDDMLDDPTHGTGLGKDGWVASRDFAPPQGFDPKHVDTAKYLPWALGVAKKMVPDAVLFRIDASGVFPDGHADLTVVDNGDLDYRFISPSRLKRDPSKPIGAKQDRRCMFRVELTKDGATSAPINGFDCNEKLIGPPKCTFAQVWKKALAKKAPSNAVGTLGYRTTPTTGDAVWYFDIDDPDVKFSEMFPDDCH